MNALQLRFSPDGGLLVCAGKEQVQVWHMRDRRLLHQQKGTLIGIASDGHTLLMEAPDKTVQAQLLYSGTVVPLDSLDAADYPLGQRCLVKRQRRAVEVIDVLTGVTICAIPLDKLVDANAASGGTYFSGALVSADGAYLAITINGDSTYGEWAKGVCIRLDGQGYFPFTVNGAANRPALHMSGRLLMIESAPFKRTLIDMRTGTPINTLAAADNQRAGQFFAVYEAEPPPLVAFHAERARITLTQAGQPPKAIVTAADVADVTFMPDQQHLAVLQESREVSFHDWRADVKKGSLYLV